MEPGGQLGTPIQERLVRPLDVLKLGLAQRQAALAVCDLLSL
jgi:hypothetical protein